MGKERVHFATTALIGMAAGGTLFVGTLPAAIETPKSLSAVLRQFALRVTK